MTAADTWLDQLVERESRWSGEQHEIYQWFNGGDGNLLVRARAGCGKTTTIVEGITRAPSGTATLLAAFNKSIADELQSRINMPNVDAKTLHGLGFAFVKRNWRVQVDRDYARSRSLAEQAIGENAPTQAKKLVRELHTKTREIDPWADTVDRMMDIAGRFDCVPDDALEARGWTLERIAEGALKAMFFAKQRCASIDFADMIFLPLVHGWVRSWFDLVVIDEAQDMTIAQLAMAVGSCRRSGRIAVVGDDRQCIYQFRGAETDGLDRLKSQLKARELGLKTTYRCGKLIVAEAAQLVPDFVAHESNADGEVLARSAQQMINEAQPGDFVLSRKNAPLIRVCVALLKRGVRARIKGSDIAKQVLALVEKMQASDAQELASKIIEWAARETRKALDKLSEEAAHERCAQIADQSSIVLALLEDVDTLEQFARKARELFDDNPGGDVVMCSSVHRAKGLEASTVYVLRSSFRTDVHSIEEDNIRYVAYTRAKRTLVFVDGEID